MTTVFLRKQNRKWDYEYTMHEALQYKLEDLQRRYMTVLLAEPVNKSNAAYIKMRLYNVEQLSSLFEYKRFDELTSNAQQRSFAGTALVAIITYSDHLQKECANRVAEVRNGMLKEKHMISDHLWAQSMIAALNNLANALETQGFSIFE